MNFLRYYIYYIFLHLTLAGSSFVQVGDAISINIDSSATYIASSNILKSETNELSDDIIKYTPGIVVNIGKSDTVLDLSLRAYNDMYEYQDYSDLDINLKKIYFNGSYKPSDLTSSNFSYSNVEGQSARSETDTRGVPALIETTREAASLTANHRYSPKLSISLGFNMSELNYDSFNSSYLASKKSQTIPFDLIYQYSNKLNLVYGVSFTDTEIGPRIARNQRAYDTESIYYNVGLRGDMLPKLTGQFNLGYRTLSYSAFTDNINALGITSNLTWELTPKLETKFNFSKDFDVSGSGSTYEFTRLILSTMYWISSEYKCSLSLGHTSKDYKSNPLIEEFNTSRKERLSNISFNMHYIPSINYSFTAGYNILRSRADFLADYDLNEFRLTAKLKY